MQNTLKAVVRDGHLEFLEPLSYPNGTKIQVTLRPESETEFWLEVSKRSLRDVWDHSEDDIYAELLAECCHPGPVSVL